MARRYSAACQTRIPCTLNWTAGGRQAGKDGGWEEGARGGSEEAMMRGRVGAGVDDGLRKELGHGRSEGNRGGRKRAE